MKISIKFNQISIVRTTILFLPINTISGRDPPLDQTNKQGDAVVSLKACITTPVESLYAKSVRKGVRSGVLRRLKARTRDKSELIQRAVAKFPRLLRGHKLYSSNVNINETNELSVMPVMTVDCCRNKRSAGFHDLPLSRLQTGPASLLYRSMCILLAMGLPWQWGHASFIDYYLGGKENKFIVFFFLKQREMFYGMVEKKKCEFFSSLSYV